MTQNKCDVFEQPVYLESWTYQVLNQHKNNTPIPSLFGLYCIICQMASIILFVRLQMLRIFFVLINPFEEGRRQRNGYYILKITKRVLILFS